MVPKFDCICDCCCCCLKNVCSKYAKIKNKTTKIVLKTDFVLIHANKSGPPEKNAGKPVGSATVKKPDPFMKMTRILAHC